MSTIVNPDDETKMLALKASLERQLKLLYEAVDSEHDPEKLLQVHRALRMAEKRLGISPPKSPRPTMRMRKSRRGRKTKRSK